MPARLIDTNGAVALVRLISHYLNEHITWLYTGESALEYTARKHLRNLILSDDREKYSTEENERIESLVAKIYKLDPGSRDLVEQMVGRLLAGGDDEDKK